MSTPRTTAALMAILESRGELCEHTAPKILVKTCRQLETELAAERAKVAKLREALSQFTHEHFSFSLCICEPDAGESGSPEKCVCQMAERTLAETAPKEGAK